MDKRKIAEKTFDEYMKKLVAIFKQDYIDSQLIFTTNEENDNSLEKKAEIIKSYMDQGMGFQEACDQRDVFVGSVDSEYVYVRYVLKSHSLSFDEWFENKFARDMSEIVELRKRR